TNTRLFSSAHATIQEMFIALQVGLLKRLSRSGRGGDESYSPESKVANCLGESFVKGIAGKTVIDFGCGEGDAAIELAKCGAERVIGVDIREEVLQLARQKARKANVEHVCSFAQSTKERADIVISLDAFEHFSDPAAIL